MAGQQLVIRSGGWPPWPANGWQGVGVQARCAAHTVRARRVCVCVCWRVGGCCTYHIRRRRLMEFGDADEWMRTGTGPRLDSWTLRGGTDRTDERRSCVETIETTRCVLRASWQRVAECGERRPVVALARPLGARRSECDDLIDVWCVSRVARLGPSRARRRARGRRVSGDAIFQAFTSLPASRSKPSAPET